MEKVLTIVRNTRDFEYALTQWENKAPSNKTWESFKTHFHEAQVNLKQIRGPTMLQSGYHHANSLAQNIQEQLSERDSQLLTLLQNIPSLSSISSGLSSVTPDTPQVTQVQESMQ